MSRRLKYPPCAINPVTEKPYTRHKWAIRQGVLRRKPGSDVLYYHVVCVRPTCQLKDPNPVTH